MAYENLELSQFAHNLNEFLIYPFERSCFQVKQFGKELPLEIYKSIQPFTFRLQCSL